MSEQKIRDLVERSHAFTITDEEVGWAADMLRQGDYGINRHGLLEIVGWSGGKQYEELGASYLECPSDYMLSRLALQILCGHWGLSAKYVEEIRRFLAGVPWDAIGMVRLVAISEAGEYLRLHADPDLARRLWEFASAPDEWLEEYEVAVPSDEKEAALKALARALGDSYGKVIGVPGSQSKETWQA